jgi:hypothetical protein
VRETRPPGSMSGEWNRSVSHRATPRLYVNSTIVRGNFSAFRPIARTRRLADPMISTAIFDNG